MTPVFILVTVEGLGINLLGCYGGAISKTPNVDAFAAKSVVFDQCWLQSLSVEESLKAVLYGRKYRMAIEQPGAADIQAPAASPIPPNLFALLQQEDIKSLFITDAVVLADSEFLDAFDEVALVDFDQEEPVSDKLDQTRMARLMQFAITKLYEDEDAMEELGLLWIHSRGLKDYWDAPYELRTIPCDEDDPEPSANPLPPRKLLDEETDPDVLFDAICGASAQAAVLDFAWSYINELIEEQNPEPIDIDSIPVSGQPFVMLLGLNGYPLGEHDAIGDIDDQLYAERLHVPLLLRTTSLPLGRRLPHLVQPWQISEMLVQCFLSDETTDEDTFWNVPPGSSMDWQDGHRIAWSASENEYALITPAWTSRVTVAPYVKENPNRADLSADAITPMAMWQVFVNPDDRFQQNDVADRVEPMVKRLSEIATRLRDAIYGTEGRIDVADLQAVLEALVSEDLMRLVR